MTLSLHEQRKIIVHYYVNCRSVLAFLIIKIDKILASQPYDYQIAPQFAVWITGKNSFIVWNPHQILSKTPMHGKLEIDVFLSAIRAY